MTRVAREDAAGSAADARARRTQMAAALAARRREFVLDARQGRGGRDAQARYAAAMDAVVTQLVDAGRTLTPAPLVVCALGGYGRRTLCLHSDIDLMILFGTSIGRDEERFVNAVLQPLWDMQLVVGHQVRELADFDELDIEQHRVPARRPRRAADYRRPRSVRAARGPRRPGDRREPRPRRRLAAGVDRAAPCAVQRHHLPARTRPQERAGRTARHRPRCATCRRSAASAATATRPRRRRPARSTPRISCCRSAASCTPRPAATPTC